MTLLAQPRSEKSLSQRLMRDRTSNCSARRPRLFGEGLRPLEYLEPRALLSVTVSSVVNSQTGAATGSLAGSGTLKTVTISGSGFLTANNVIFGSVGVPLSQFTIKSDNEIISAFPASSIGAGTVNVLVNTPSGISVASSGNEFTYNNPVVTSMSTYAGPIAGGTPVTLTGQYFTGASSILFGTLGVPAYTVVDDATITTTSPASPNEQSVNVQVTVNGVQSATGAGNLFTYAPAPAITSLGTNTGPDSGGTPVTIHGSGFTGATSVQFAGQSVPFTFVSDAKITTTSPVGTGTVDVTVTTAIGTSALVSADQFRYATLPLYLTIPQDVANHGVYLTMFGKLEENYTNSFSTSIPSGTLVYLVSTGSGYDYMPLSTLGNSAPIPPFFVTNTATTILNIGLPNVAIKASRVQVGIGAVTTVAGASIGQSLPQSTINVTSTAGFATSGILEIVTQSGSQTTVNYQGITPTSFTLASGGSGTLSAASTVRAPALLTTVSGAQTISTSGGTLNVVSTQGFPTSGSISVATNSGIVQVPYTSTSATSFNVSSITTALSVVTGNVVSGTTLPGPSTNAGGGVAAPTPGSMGSNIYDFFEVTYIPDTGTQVLKLTANTSGIDQFGLPMILDLAGQSVQPSSRVGVQLTRQQIMGVPGAGPGLFSEFVNGTGFTELMQDGFGNVSTARITSPKDQLTINSVQNVMATPLADSGTLPAGTYYYAVTALAGTQESQVSQFGYAVLPSTGHVSLIWGASQNSATTSYNVYRGTLGGGSISWQLVNNVSTPLYNDAAPGGAASNGPPIDALSSYFNQTISELFSSYTTRPLHVTVTDGSVPANGIQYTFAGVAQQEPEWVAAITGPSATPRTVFVFTCVDITNNPNSNPVLIPLGSMMFVYKPFFNTNTTTTTNPSPPFWPGTSTANQPPYNLIPSAQVFAATGVFADNVPQSAAMYNAANQPAHLSETAYSVALGSIEDMLNAALVRGIATTMNSRNWANAPTQLAAGGSATGSLPTDTTYYYVVTAIDSRGESTPSNQTNATAPQGGISLTWQPVSNATEYHVYRGIASGAANELIGVVSGENNTTFVDSLVSHQLPIASPPTTGTMTSPVLSSATPSSGGQLDTDQIYYYVVTALGTNGESLGSNELSATTTSLLRGVTLNWSRQANASAYKIYRGTSSSQENVLVGTLQGSGANAIITFTDAGHTNQNPPPNIYYAPGSVADLYGQFFHQTFVSIGGLAYADPFDDQGNQSSTSVATSPQSITLSLGSWSTIVSASSQELSGSNLTIEGVGFGLTPAANTVNFNSGSGSVLSVNSTGTELVFHFTTLPTEGPLIASILTTFGGNSGAPVQVATVPDTTPPVATILFGPAHNTASSTATFLYTASDNTTPTERLVYQTSLDGGQFQLTSNIAVTYTNLELGSHTFIVRAIDEGGNVSQPVSYHWNVAAPASIQVRSGGNQSAAVGASFSSPMVLVVLDSNGYPVADAIVTVVTTSSILGARVVSQLAVSDLSGTVYITLAANTVAGQYTNRAISGLIASEEFLLSNVPLHRIATGSAPGRQPRVDVYDSAGSLRGSFLAFRRQFRGGVRVIQRDVNNDGVDDLILRPVRGVRNLVKIVDGTKIHMKNRNGVISNRALLARFHLAKRGLSNSELG